MCDSDVEHLLHVFFDCPFATSCWHYVGIYLEMSEVEYAPDWLLQTLSTAGHDQLVQIARVLWGIWFFHNKRVWEDKTVNGRITMEWSLKYFNDWKAAKKSRATTTVHGPICRQESMHRWKPPATGSYKLNADASIKLGDNTFSVGFVLRDHAGGFVMGQVRKMLMVSSVFEAEVVAIREGLQWASGLPYHKIEIESDSLLAVHALTRPTDITLEVGYVLDECSSLIRSRPGLSIHFAKRQANKVAHLMARVPYFLECPSIFTSPPSSLVEALLYDVPS